MSLRPDLEFTYNRQGQPIAAKCCVCGTTMPPPPADLTLPADVIVWLSRRDIEDKAELHASSRLNKSEN